MTYEIERTLTERLNRAGHDYREARAELKAEVIIAIQLGMTQRTAAKASGLATSTINRWWQDATNPRG